MNKLSIEKLEYIKSKYGHMSSFAIWKDKDIKEKSNMDVLLFEDNINKLNVNIILVGLNISKKIDIPFSNFHPNYSTAHDYKIRYALKDTMFYGAYMTDIIKDFEEKVSEKLMKYLKNNPTFLQENILSFENELIDIGSTNPILIAFGHDCYKILNNNFKDKYRIYKVSHYSSCISKEKLRIEFQDIIVKIINYL